MPSFATGLGTATTEKGEIVPDSGRLGMDDPQQIGAYRLVGVLGEGGQGTVYLGQDPSGRRVAVKVLHTRMAAEAALRERFEREAELARRVAVFCTAQVLEAGIERGRPYLVSEYVPGPSLQQLVTTEGPRTGSGLERLAVATATALAAIHRVGIVHRDFKPANVIMGPEGPVVIDFGIARILEASATNSALVGSPGYMAPEQLSDGPAGPASDVFAWAATMVYAATGHPAFTGQHPAAVMNAVMNGEPDLNGVPRGLRSLLTSCLAKNPASRPTADRVLATLTGNGTAQSPFGGNGSQEANRTVPGRLTGSPAAPGSPAPADQGAGPSPRPHPDDVTMYGTPGERGPRMPPPPVPHRAGANPFPPRSGKTPERSAAQNDAHPAGAGHAPAVFASGNGGSAATAPSERSAVAASTPTGISRRRVPPFALATVAAVAVGAVAGVVIYMGTSPTDIDPSTVPTAVPSSTSSAPSTAPSATTPVDTGYSATYSTGSYVASHMASTKLNGHPAIVWGSWDDSLRVWDLTTGTQIGGLMTGHTDDVIAVATGQLDGRPIAVSSSRDKTVRVWDLTTREQIGEPFTEHTDEVFSIAVTELDDRAVVISGGRDKTVRVWDLATKQPIGKPITNDLYVWSVAVAQVDGRPAVAAAVGSSIHVWDLATHKPVIRPIEYVGATTLAVTELDGRPAIVSDGAGNTVRVWDLTTGKQLRQPLTGHTEKINSVVVTELNDLPVVASGGWDKTVRIWDLTTGKQIGNPFTGHTDDVNSLIAAEWEIQPVVVSSSADRSIRVWDLVNPSKGD
ncbi:protein kinase [Planomonospora corallina]|uniref:Protein kinase n=1 Tax=Planomonospora corallina TaxID=1806052 RepID=A0ABV8I3Z7_9ACTN